MIFVIRWCLSAASTTPRRSRETSTAHKQATCFRAHPCLQAGGYVQAPAWTNTWPSVSGTKPRCRAWYWVVRNPTPGYTRITHSFTAPIFPGAAPQRPRRWRCTRHWHLIAFSRTKRRRVTRVCWTRCWPRPRICGATSAGRTSRSSMNTSIPCGRWSSASRVPASAVNCRAGGRR